MKTRIALPHVLAGSALILWAGHLTAQVPIGIRAPVDQVVMQGLLRYDLQTLDLPATEQEPFTATVRLGDQMQTLVLNPYTMRAENFQVLVQGEDGQLREVEPPPPRTYRGTVQGEPLSRVAATLMDRQLWAMVAQESGGVWFIQPLSEFGVVGASDLLSLLVQWGADPGGPPDFDGDGNVGASDLLALLANWGPCR